MFARCCTGRQDEPPCVQCLETPKPLARSGRACERPKDEHAGPCDTLRGTPPPQEPQDCLLPLSGLLDAL